MPAIYPLHLQREIDRRWLRRSEETTSARARLKGLSDFLRKAAVVPENCNAAALPTVPRAARSPPRHSSRYRDCSAYASDRPGYQRNNQSTMINRKEPVSNCSGGLKASAVLIARIPHFDLGLVVQNHVQQGIMDFQFSVVFYKTQFTEFVHEKAYA